MESTEEKLAKLVFIGKDITKENINRNYTLIEVMQMNRHQRRAICKANGIALIPGSQEPFINYEKQAKRNK